MWLLTALLDNAEIENFQHCRKLYWTTFLWKVLKTSQQLRTEIGNKDLGLCFETVSKKREKSTCAENIPQSPKMLKTIRLGRKNMYLTEGANYFWSLISHRFLFTIKSNVLFYWSYWFPEFQLRNNIAVLIQSSNLHILHM